jgi:hypothetical protein
MKSRLITSSLAVICIFMLWASLSPFAMGGDTGTDAPEDGSYAPLGGIPGADKILEAPDYGDENVPSTKDAGDAATVDAEWFAFNRAVDSAAITTADTTPSAAAVDAAVSAYVDLTPYPEPSPEYRALLAYKKEVASKGLSSVPLETPYTIIDSTGWKFKMSLKFISIKIPEGAIMHGQVVAMTAPIFISTLQKTLTTGLGTVSGFLLKPLAKKVKPIVNKVFKGGGSKKLANAMNALLNRIVDADEGNGVTLKIKPLNILTLGKGVSVNAN